MTTTVQITAALLKTLRPEIDAAVAAIAAKHGLVIKSGNGSYGGATGKLTLELAVPNGSGSTNPTHIRAAADWNKYHEMFRLPADGVGKSIEHKGEKHTIVGLLPNRTKFPVLTLCSGGSVEMLLTSEEVSKKLAVAA